LREVIADADAAHDVVWVCSALFMQALMLAFHGTPLRRGMWPPQPSRLCWSLAGSTRASLTRG
jgi:hypothetical protein